MRHELMTEDVGLGLLEHWSLSADYDNEAFVENETHFHCSQREEWNIEEWGVSDVLAEISEVGRSEVKNHQS